MFTKLECINPPAPRGGHTMAILKTANDVVGFLFGGCDRNGKQFNDMQILSINKKIWTNIKYNNSNIPNVRSGHTSIVYNNNIYIYGGCKFPSNSEEQMLFYNDLWCFNTVDLTWKLILTENAPIRSSHTAEIINNLLYIIGGSNENGPYSDIWQLDLNSDEYVWTNAVKISKEENIPGFEMHVSVVQNKSIFIIGGRGDELYDSFYELNTLTGTFVLHDHCFPLCGSSGILIDNRAILFGGTDCKTFYNCLYVYDILNAVWIQVDEIDILPRMAHTFKLYNNNQAILFGGAGLDNEFNDTYIFTDSEKTKFS